MKLFKKAEDLNRCLKRKRTNGESVGFVPTMGALHEGHLSLISACNERCDTSVCSIFVNPTQFNNQEDFQKYPKTLPNDILLLEETRCDIVFLPAEEEIYPDESARHKAFDLGYIETILEGKFRPGHFQGVCNVVEKLLHTVNPDILFLGRKDFQQCIVIRRLLDLMNSKTELIICPIVREESGLAKSSRNARLSEQGRVKAAQLFRSLQFIKDNLGQKTFHQLQTEVKQDLLMKGFDVEYLELAKRDSLEPVELYAKQVPLVLLIAAYTEGVRLIDNLLIN